MRLVERPLELAVTARRRWRVGFVGTASSDYALYRSWSIDPSDVVQTRVFSGQAQELMFLDWLALCACRDDECAVVQTAPKRGPSGGLKDATRMMNCRGRV